MQQLISNLFSTFPVLAIVSGNVYSFGNSRLIVKCSSFSVEYVILKVLTQIYIFRWFLINCLGSQHKFHSSLPFQGQLGQAGGDRRPAEARRGRLRREQERADSAHRPHQERGEGRDHGPAGYHQQEGPAVSKVSFSEILSGKGFRQTDRLFLT